jgi:hypothetical protein
MGTWWLILKVILIRTLLEMMISSILCILEQIVSSPARPVCWGLWQGLAGWLIGWLADRLAGWLVVAAEALEPREVEVGGVEVEVGGVEVVPLVGVEVVLLVGVVEQPAVWLGERLLSTLTWLGLLVRVVVVEYG